MLYAFYETAVLIDDAEAQGDISPAVSRLHMLAKLREAAAGETFDDRQYRRIIRAQGETVEVPKEMLDPIIDAWESYASPNATVDFAGAFGVNRKGQRTDARTAVTTLTNYYYLAMQVWQERVQAHADGEDISLEEARGRVLDHYDETVAGISDETLRRAWARWGNLIERSALLLSHKPPP